MLGSICLESLTFQCEVKEKGADL